MFLPRALSAIPDARNALQRLEKVFHAELMSREPFEVDREGEWAVCVQEGVFEWESVRKGGNNKGKKDEKEKEKVEKDRKPFQVRLKEFKVERGSLVAIVGPVGSGKVTKYPLRTVFEWITDRDTITVESPTRSHRGDEKDQRRRDIRRASELLCADGLDTKCDFGNARLIASFFALVIGFSESGMDLEK